jgi:HlyD family secretion protein
VRNGDHVRQHQVLVVLDDTQTRAELGIIQSQLNELRARRARYIAERNRDSDIAFPSDLSEHEEGRAIIMGELRVMKEGRETRSRQKEQLELRISQLKREIEGVTSQREAKQRELHLIEKELKAVRNLFDRKLTPATRLYGLEREQTRLSGEHGSLTSNLARLEGQISEIRLKRSVSCATPKRGFPNCASAVLPSVTGWGVWRSDRLRLVLSTSLPSIRSAVSSPPPSRS